MRVMLGRLRKGGRGGGREERDTGREEEEVGGGGERVRGVLEEE